MRARCAALPVSTSTTSPVSASSRVSRPTDGSSRSCRSPVRMVTTSCRRASARSSGELSATPFAPTRKSERTTTTARRLQALAHARGAPPRGSSRGPSGSKATRSRTRRRVCARPRAGGTNVSTVSVKSDEADAVIAAERREREDARDLDRLLALGRVPGAERAGRAHVDDEDDRELALFAVLLDERAARARRRVPVDRADVVARLVFAELVEVHPATAEARLHAAVERVVAEAPRADLDAARLLGDALVIACRGPSPDGVLFTATPPP